MILCDPLFGRFQLAAFFLAQFHKSIFVAGQFVAENIPFPALLPAISGEHPRIGERLPARHHRVHDLVDIVKLPPLRLVKGVAQRLLKKLFGADHAAGVVFQKALYLHGLGVLRHEILLHLHKLSLDGFAEFHGVVAAAVNRHGLRPDLQQIGSGSVLVLQNVNLCILRVNHNRQKAPVPGPVKGQEVQRVGRTAEHALPQPVFGLGLVGCAVGFFLAADQIGASYFLKLKTLNFDQLWTDYLQPLLHEYVQGMYDEDSLMSRFAKAYGYQKPSEGDAGEDTQG